MMSLDFPGFTPSGNASGWFFNHPCCPNGCDPCGDTYYKRGNKHNSGCCQGGICASRQQLEATRQWLEKWLQAEKEYQVAAWVEAEKQHRSDVLIWLENEKYYIEAWLEEEEYFIQSLAPRGPQIVHKPRKENSPAKEKHVKAMQRHQ